MKFSENWLREWVNPDVDSEALAAQLTMLGLEVDGVEPAANFPESVVVAEIISAEKHPDADKLQVCQVDDGSGETLQIVCGAPNARVGLKTALARLGTVMPGGMKIKKAKLRGVASTGMLCSSKELGLGEGHDGIMELPEASAAGMSLLDFFDAKDQMIEIDLTPNRGDCASVRGVAYDIAAKNQIEVTVPTVEPVLPAHDEVFPLSIATGCGCSRYVGRIIKGIKPGVSSPLWLVEKLRRSGVRSISPVVDVTNYVMMEFGQPMHGFDLSKLDAEIQVRLANPGEKLTLLDGREVVLESDTLVIADQAKPLAIAGVMGGEDSGVTDQTIDIVFESALFLPSAIMGRPRHYNAHTDSGYRFERGVDPDLQTLAIERATALLIDIVGGDAGPLFSAEQAELLIDQASVFLRRERLDRVMGMSMPSDDVTGILQRLGMAVTVESNGWAVEVPKRRYDISREEDLIEELARIYGYDNLPRRLPSDEQRMKPSQQDSLSSSFLADVLVQRGYQESVTYSFIDEETHKLVDPEGEFVRLANPISEDLSIMRTSLWPGLLLTAQRNVKRQQSRMKFFETGLRFLVDKGELDQRPTLSGLCMGSVLPENWQGDKRSVDFFTVKADLEALFGLCADSIEFVQDSHPALHPGCTARLNCVGKTVGWVGELHPKLQKVLDVPNKCVVFEIDMSVFNSVSGVTFKPLSKYPRVRRDIALLVDDAVSFEQLKQAVTEVAPQYLEEVLVFDVYTGQGVADGTKSVALGLILQEFSRTLSDQEVDQDVAVILENLNKNLNATLRE